MLSRFLCVACAMPLLTAGSVLAQQGVMFLDGGYAELCAAAARQIEEPGRLDITGSRLGLGPMEACDLAVRAPDATPDQRAGSYNNRGVIKFSQGDIDGALADFDAAISIRDDLGQAHVNRGYVFVAKQRWQECIAAFDRGIALGANEMEKAYFNRGIAHEELGHAREAYYDYLKASELKPEWEDPARELSRFRVKR